MFFDFVLRDVFKCLQLFVVVSDLLDECEINVMGLYLEKFSFLFVVFCILKGGLVRFVQLVGVVRVVDGKNILFGFG